MFCPKFSLFLVTHMAQGKAPYPPIETSILKASNIFVFFVLVIMGQSKWLITQEQIFFWETPPI